MLIPFQKCFRHTVFSKNRILFCNTVLLLGRKRSRGLFLSYGIRVKISQKQVCSDTLFFTMLHSPVYSNDKVLFSYRKRKPEKASRPDKNGSFVFFFCKFFHPSPFFLFILLSSEASQKNPAVRLWLLPPEDLL